MAHRANIYSVRVRRRRDTTEESYLPLGDFTGSGLSLQKALQDISATLAVATDEGTTRIATAECDAAGDEVFMMFRHGQSGQAAEIDDENDAFLFHQQPEHTHYVMRACLFVLPPTQTRGWLSVHVDAARSVKGLLSKGLGEEFRSKFPDVVLEINPVVAQNALRSAAEQDRIEKVELITLIPPSDLADAALQKWMKAGRAAKVRIDISGLTEAEGEGRRGRRRIHDRILPNLLRRYFQGEAEVLPTILEFRGLQFDEAHFVVAMPNGTTRTFNLGRPEGGHAISEDLQGLQIEDGDPTPDSLRAALRAALADQL